MGQWAGKIPGKPDLPDDTNLGQVVVDVMHGETILIDGSPGVSLGKQE